MNRDDCQGSCFVDCLEPLITALAAGTRTRALAGPARMPVISPRTTASSRQQYILDSQSSDIKGRAPPLRPSSFGATRSASGIVTTARISAPLHPLHPKRTRRGSRRFRPNLVPRTAIDSCLHVLTTLAPPKEGNGPPLLLDAEPVCPRSHPDISTLAIETREARLTRLQRPQLSNRTSTHSLCTARIASHSGIARRNSPPSCRGS